MARIEDLRALLARLCRAKGDFGTNKGAENGRKLPRSMSAGRRRHKVVTRGFTLIELLVVILILGIVASVGASLIGARDKAFLAVMKADLRSLAFEQSAYVVENYAYANSLTDLQSVSSDGVTLELLGETFGFSARTTHPGLPDARCAIFLGTVSSVFSPATDQGMVTRDGVGGGCGQGVPNSKGKAQGPPC